MRNLQTAIDEETDKLIRRFESYARQLADEQRRRTRRTTQPVSRLRLQRPVYWALADGFNPYLVRSRRDRIAYSVQNRLSTRTYESFTPFQHFVPKVGGGLREVCVFQLADSAVSRIVFDGLMEKNRVRMSSRAYAYRDDITAQDAIQYIAAEMRGQSRVFVADYDFSKYFDNIGHDYLQKILQDRQFLTTRSEKAVVDAFLRVTPLPADAYQSHGGPKRQCGIPQGTSISLFLANIAAWELDRALERLGVSFVRYADDTLIWATDYAQLCRAVDILHEMALRIGSPINLQKSGGIRLLVQPGAPSEMPPVQLIEYLGHRITLSSVGMKAKRVERIKKHINELLYFNLVKEPEAGTQNPLQLGRVDRDYVTYIWQLRRYLYGDISERGLRRFQARGVPQRRFRGVMSFFPLVEDMEQLKELDSWLVCSTCLAMRKRTRILTSLGYNNLPDPHGLSCKALANFVRKSQTTGGSLDLRLPSFQKIASVIRRAATQYGTNSIARTSRYEY
jgi:RNA-directed DNA polymerase